MAAVFCASFRRRAMVARRRVILTRSSRAASSAGPGARGGRRGRGGGKGRRRRPRGRDAGHVILHDAAIAAGALHLRRGSDQPRPSLFSRRGRFRRPSRRGLTGCGAGGCGCGLGGGGRQRRHPRSPWRGGRCGPTVVPSGAMISASTPKPGLAPRPRPCRFPARTAFRPASPRRPGFLNQVDTVASDTDSPKGGHHDVSHVQSPVL